jgi:hypothetical protein
MAKTKPAKNTKRPYAVQVTTARANAAALLTTPGLDETRRRRERPGSRLAHKDRPLALNAPLTPLHDSQILLFDEWCRLNRISERQGRRILDNPGGPVVTQLTRRRIGITVAANRRWQQSRARRC